MIIGKLDLTFLTFTKLLALHLPMTKGGRAKVELGVGVGDADGVVLGEGEGAFVEGFGVGNVSSVERGERRRRW